MIRGARIAVRPVERADLPILEAWTNDVNVHGIYNAFGLERRNGLEAGFNAQGFLTEQQGMLMIVTLAGEVVGSMSYHQVGYGPNSGSRAYNIGLSITADQRGNGYGTEAQRLLADYLLQTYPIARVEASTDISNIAEQRALEKAGFTREGVLRKAQWRAGEWHDLVVYSRVRGD
jgi:RimJ/RimL family protein N-acetyltransferase